MTAASGGVSFGDLFHGDAASTGAETLDQNGMLGVNLKSRRRSSTWQEWLVVGRV